MGNDFETATGVIDYTFLNDYMFKKILQDNKPVLKALLCALLHKEKHEITDVEVLNPITDGTSVESKEFILDLKLLLNDNSVINIEMQVINYHDWPERSLQYLCRTYDGLQKGEDYSRSKPATHIAFLDFTLFDDNEEFYATYKLMNEKTGHVYTDKFVMKYVDMTKIHLATDEDKSYAIDKWVELFKAKTWEDLRMVASQSKEMNIAANNLFVANADQQEIWRAQAREDYERHERQREFLLAKYKKEKAEAEKQKAEVEKQKAEIEAQSNKQIDELKSEVSVLKQKLLEAGINP